MDVTTDVVGVCTRVDWQCNSEGDPVGSSPFITILFVISLTTLSTGTNKKELFKGLSDSDRELLKDSQMSPEKFQELREADITLEEYFQYPWLQYRISEKEWLKQRQAGILKSDQLSSNEIKSREWAVVHNFFVPGLHQFKRHQILKGFMMSGIAAGALAAYALHRNPNEGNRLGFDYHGYLLLLGADLLWSSIDIGIQIHKELNKNAVRFSSIVPETNYFISYDVPINNRIEHYVTHVSQW